MAVAARHAAAVAALDLDGTEDVLEIGCGHGVAVRLVLDRLTTGRIVALDRSQAMIDRVLTIADDRITTRLGALEHVDLGDQRFDAIFAVNLDLNLRMGAVWTTIIQRILRPAGRLVLAFEAPPGSAKGEVFARTCIERLGMEGFAVERLAVDNPLVLLRAMRTAAAFP